MDELSCLAFAFCLAALFAAAGAIHDWKEGRRA